MLALQISVGITILDGIGATVILLRGWDLSRLVESFKSYTATDITDLWVMTIVKAICIFLLLAASSYGWFSTGDNNPRQQKPKGKPETNEYGLSSWMSICNMILQALALILILGKISFLLCFSELVKEGVGWHWALVAESLGASFAEFWIVHIALENIRIERLHERRHHSGGRTQYVYTALDQSGEWDDDLTVHSKSCELEESGETCGAKTTEEKDNQETEGLVSQIEKLRTKRAIIARLCSLASADWMWLSCGFAFLLVAAYMQALIPKLTGLVINDVVVERSVEKFQQGLMSLTFVSVLAGVSAGFRGACFIVAMAKLNMRIRDLTFRAIMRQEVSYFDETRTGDLMSRLSSDCQTMSEAVGLNLNLFLRSTVQAAGLFAFMLASQRQLSVVTFASVPVVSVVSRLYGEYYAAMQKRVQDALAECNSVAEEAMGSVRTVRSFAAEERECDEHMRRLGEVLKLNVSQAAAYIGYSAVTTAAPLLVAAAVLYFGGHMVIMGELQGSDLVSFVFYQQSLTQAINSIGDVFTGLMRAAGAADKVFAIIDRKSQASAAGSPGRI